MNIELTELTLKAVRKAGAKSPVILDERNDWHGRTIAVDHLVPGDFAVIKEVLRSAAFWKDLDSRRIVRKLEAIEAFRADGKQAKVTKLELLPEAVKQLLFPTPHRWLFLPVRPFGVLLPYFVTGARYFPPERTSGGDYHPAHAAVYLAAASRGVKDDKTLDFERAALGGTVEAILSGADALVETEKLVAEYEVDLARYKEYAPQMGEQFLARGSGSVLEGRWSRGAESFERDGVPAKVVMEDAKEKSRGYRGDERFTGFAGSKFWTKAKHVSADEDDDESEEGEESFLLPTHPIVRVFNLGTHEFVEAHIGNLEPYPYDAAIREKLILPADHRALIDTLMLGAVRRMDDIVKGKACGVIVLASGKPGTGKTLTAEVYAEVAKRPLYAVQCSQLGTSETELEKSLAEVLERAHRWRAILLIDEADVYIHERGSDIQQNAIVGIFLRLLEYYSGVLFMTTNRACVIDDAILSRATAHVKYDVPNAAQAVMVWGVLAKQYGVKDLSVEKAAAEFVGISGRSVRQLLRLGIAIADQKKEKVGITHLKEAAKFHDFTERE
jgi:hypothetical protein